MGAEGVAEFAEAAEARADVFGVVEQRRNGHQAAEIEVRQGEDGFRERGKFAGVDAGFGEFGREANLDENGEARRGRRSAGLKAAATFGKGMVEFLGKGEAVHRVNRVKQADGAAGFIALEVADEVPSGVEAGDLRELPFPLLDAILTKVADTGLVGLADVLRRKCFRNRDESNLVWIPSRARGGAGDAFVHGGKVFRDAHEQ